MNTYPKELYEILNRFNQLTQCDHLNQLCDRSLDLLVEYSQASTGRIELIDPTTGKTTHLISQGDVPDRQTQDDGLDDQINFPLVINIEPGLPATIGNISLFETDEATLQLTQLLVDRVKAELERVFQFQHQLRHNDRLKALIDYMGQIGSSLDRDHILRMIIDDATELLGSESCSLFMVDNASGDSVLHLASNRDPLHIEQIRVPAGKGIIGHTVVTGEITLVADASRDDRHYTEVDRDSGFTTRSLVAVPLRTGKVTLGEQRGQTQEQIIGALEAVNKLEGTFDEDDAQLLQTLANQAATVLHIAELYADANELFINIIQAFTAAIDAKDAYTEGHSQRVSDYSVVIASELSLPLDMVYHIRIGGLLHDIGKIGVPDAILSKPGRLTEQEYERMKAHPEIGERITGQIRMLRDEVPAIAEHHEWINGTGYPRKINADEISLLGKIVAVADVFDAMTSDRPYRNGLSVEETLRFLQTEAGVHFDVECVSTLIRAYHKGSIKVPKEQDT